MSKRDKKLLFVLIVLTLIALYNMIMQGPVTVDNLTVEERIRYEQRIFP